MEDDVRLAVLETKVGTLEQNTADMRKKVDEMHAVLMQAKGAKWTLWALLFAAGAISSSIGSALHVFTTGKL